HLVVQRAVAAFVIRIKTVFSLQWLRPHGRFLDRTLKYIAAMIPIQNEFARKYAD
ncbi:MAG: hypothetical protein RJB19_56, partial [Pseudomonadota bacterium]